LCYALVRPDPSTEGFERRSKDQETQAVRLPQPGNEEEPHLVGLNLPLLVRDKLIGVLEAYGPVSLLARQNEETLISLANQGASPSRTPGSTPSSPSARTAFKT
jgi:hypothetical protein